MVKPAAQHDGQRGAETRKLPESVGGGFWVGRVHGFVVEGNGESLSLPLPKVSRILPAPSARLRRRGDQFSRGYIRATEANSEIFAQRLEHSHVASLRRGELHREVADFEAI